MRYRFIGILLLVSISMVTGWEDLTEGIASIYILDYDKGMWIDDYPELVMNTTFQSLNIPLDENISIDFKLSNWSYYFLFQKVPLIETNPFLTFKINPGGVAPWDNDSYLLVAGNNSHAGISFVNDFNNMTGSPISGFVYYPELGGLAFFDFWNQSLIPLNHKVQNLGSNLSSWNDCYCDDYYTTSKGYITPYGKSPLDVLLTLETKETGEINHEKQDSSLGDNTATSLNSVIMMQAEAMKEIYTRLKYLEFDNAELLARVTYLEKKCG